MQDSNFAAERTSITTRSWCSVTQLGRVSGASAIMAGEEEVMGVSLETGTCCLTSIGPGRLSLPHLKRSVSVAG